MDSNVVDKCLAFCQALVTINKTFSFNLSISKDSFVFTNEELTRSSCKVKKKSPSQVRRELRRKKERELKKSEVTVNVTDQTDPEISHPETSKMYSCNHCEMTFKTEKGLNTHIGRVHKEDIQENTPENERFEELDVFFLTLTPFKEVREEPQSKALDICQHVCIKCGDLWGP